MTARSVCWERTVSALSAHKLILPWTHRWVGWALKCAFLFLHICIPWSAKSEIELLIHAPQTEPCPVFTSLERKLLNPTSFKKPFFLIK